ncbi:MAG TPA: PhzF family phenazine biosynthesis isomerase [Candidatus Cloacimonadota bacterium]|nr:PhzF family phenazine biosynthesis isomerase [Candidatus Cloacimonadota bacterium]HPT73032.1 PhzF family phenazine biosynthesis isomerase [Candidatus Cloacimonadota bacterium]
MIPIYIVDAFTDKPFAGNQAGVVLLDKPADEEWMQKVALEMGFSETAFTYPVAEGEIFGLRWFTPMMEVMLCGHATLATAKVLFSAGMIKGEKVTFETMSGRLYASREEEYIKLDFPAEMPVNVEKNNRITDAFELMEVHSISYASKNGFLLIHLPKEKTVVDLKPNMNLVRKVELTHLKGVIVTAKSRKGYDFVSRFFTPWEGIDEDPVTGSAHTVLAPYWGKILKKKEMKAFQASSRGGELLLRLLDNERVEILGHAVIVSKGELLV